VRVSSVRNELGTAFGEPRPPCRSRRPAEHVR
jgi:hypothetical protein